MQLEMFKTIDDPKIKLEDIFEAYFECRKNKRNTINALDFEVNYETNLIQLWNDINDKTYQIGKSICFIVNKPVKREIFAADFRDRIVHHLIVNKMNKLFELLFIKDTYSCRKNKGTLYGQHRIYNYIKESSQNYTKDCYILKMDIKAFFMNINKKLLYKKLQKFLSEYYLEPDKDIVLGLFKQVIFHCPQQNCIKKSALIEWQDLPKSKSLFSADDNHGLAIGNLTSQILANFYLHDLDAFISKKFKYYGRYVDDFIIVHDDKKVLSKMIKTIRNFLQKKLNLELHPKKIYLQHFSKGVSFVGGYLKPGRVYVNNRTKINFYNSVFLYNKKLKQEGRSIPLLKKFQASINSYLGYMKHYSSRYLRLKGLKKIDLCLRLCFSYDNKFAKIKLHKNKLE